MTTKPELPALPPSREFYGHDYVGDKIHAGMGFIDEDLEAYGLACYEAGLRASQAAGMVGMVKSNDPGRDRQIGISDEGHDSFWKWIRKAYRNPEALDAVFSLWNMQVAFKAGWLDAIAASPTTVASEAPAIVQDRAARAQAEPVATRPLDKLMDAFITSEMHGGEKRYVLIFKYPTHEALFAAEDQLHAFRTAAPTIPQAIPPVQGDQPTPAGYALVPREPTPAMQRAAEEAYRAWSAAEVPWSTFEHSDSYRAMISAAPQVAHPQPLAASEAEPEPPTECFYVRFAKEWITADDAARQSIKEWIEGWYSIDKDTPTASSAPKAEGEAVNRDNLIEQAFQLVFEGYNEPRDRHNGDHGYIMFLRGKLTTAFGILQRVTGRATWAADNCTQPPSEANRAREGGDVVAKPQPKFYTGQQD